MILADWVIVVPVKLVAAKSRFGPNDNVALARAMALDTVAVALTVGRVIVVTADAAAFASEVSALGAQVVPDPGAGLNAAISRGLDIAGLESPRAVLLGDHPALTPVELREVLAAAAEHPLSFVSDAEGDGTAITAAAPGVPHAPHFGAGSAAAHRSAGYWELFGAWPGLRRDVDLAEHLTVHLDGVPVGPRTSELLAALRA